MKALPDTLLLPQRALFRAGAATDLLTECAAFGCRGLLVHGASLAANGRLDRILAARPTGLTVECWRHPGGEPALDHLEDLRAAARRARPDWIAAVGGGSVMDLAKAAGGVTPPPLPAVAYHDGTALPSSRLPFLAAPTTAGTGSEATSVCVLTNSATGVKKSFRHPSLLARVVILDPDLLAACPPPILAHAGMDALTQAIESFISRGATLFSDALALPAVTLIAANLETAFRQPAPETLGNLLAGSYLAGLALSHARLGVVHGLAHPLGARYHAAHGLVCALCLPVCLEFNRRAVEERYARLSAAVGTDLLARVHALNATLSIRSPFAGQPIRDRQALIAETLASGSTAANPRTVTAPDVEALLARLFAGPAPAAH